MMVYIVKITVDPLMLEAYKRILQEEMEMSLRLEEDVHVLYAVWDKEHTNRFTIVEVYKDQEAYERHLNSPHLQKYFAETKEMVQHLEASEVVPLVEGLRMK